MGNRRRTAHRLDRVERLERDAPPEHTGPTAGDVLPLDDPECVADLRALYAAPGPDRTDRATVGAARRIYTALTGDGSWIPWAESRGEHVPAYVRRALHE